MNKHTPTNITVNKTQKTIVIAWADEHTSILRFALVRKACPCAECRGGHENMSKEPDPNVFLIPLHDSRETELLNLEAVGNYAINITWGDGHKYGIYGWDYLRALDQA